MKPKYINKLSQIPQIGRFERMNLDRVTGEFAFRANDYYLSLIDWSDPDDPIKRIVIPDMDELVGWGSLDASNEFRYTKVPGLEHKYDSTALLLVNDVCGAYCRFCFRKRLFMNDNDEVAKDVSQGIAYISEHDEIDNVLLTGGDPLVLSTARLEKIISQVRSVPHVRIIRIGSKMPAFNPFRIIDDPQLPEMLSKYIHAERPIYLMAHFNHPRELTKEAMEGLRIFQKAGVTVVNQTPLVRGVNDDSEVLAELFNKLSYIGVTPYYVFIGRPTQGNLTYTVPVEEGLDIFEEAQSLCSGLAKRARLVMSHTTGKIEITGRTQDHLILRYHRTPDENEYSGIMIVKRNPEGYWLDDFEPVGESVLADY